MDTKVEPIKVIPDHGSGGIEQEKFRRPCYACIYAGGMGATQPAMVPGYLGKKSL
jgi:hypothetical protein